MPDQSGVPPENPKSPPLPFHACADHADIDTDHPFPPVFHQKCPEIDIYHPSAFQLDSAGHISILPHEVSPDKAYQELRYRSVFVFELAGLISKCSPVCDVILGTDN